VLTQPFSRDALRQPIALVSTPQYVLAIDLYSGGLWLVEEGEPEYYGISWFPNSRELVLSHTGLDSTSLTSADAIRASERGWVSVGPRALPGSLASPHQVLCAPDGRVICTNTGRNAIYVLDPSHPGHAEVARISEREWDRQEFDDATGDHLNSIFLKGRDLYVVAHGFTGGSKLARFDYPSLKLHEVRPVPLRTGLHNVWVQDAQQAVVCDSNAGALMDTLSNELLWRCPAGEPRYLRGLAVTDDLIVVGAGSVVARSLRSASVTELWLIRREDFTTLAGWNLGYWGAVRDVRVANMADEAHHGHEFAGLTHLLAGADIQDSATPLSVRGPTPSDGPSVWEPFDRLLVAGSFASEGTFVAAPGVSLFVERHPLRAAERTLEFDFDLRDIAAEGHCAVVLYEGFGGDTHMDALLLHASADSRCSLSQWTHDGANWRDPVHLKTSLPAKGRFCVRLGGAGADVLLNGTLIARTPVSSLAHLRGRLGIRLSGCRVAQPRISSA
jgi:hypothetical protein